MLQSSKLLSVFKPDTLSGVLTLFNDHNLSYSRTGPEDAVVNNNNNLTLTRVHQLKYLGYLKLIGSGYNWCHWSPIRWGPCGALNQDVQDVYVNGCTVNGTVHVLGIPVCVTVRKALLAWRPSGHDCVIYNPGGYFVSKRVEGINILPSPWPCLLLSDVRIFFQHFKH